MEAGENPARARRREVHMIKSLLTRCRNREQVIEADFSFEKTKAFCTAAGILSAKITLD